MEEVLRKSQLRWLGHLHTMEDKLDNRLTCQVMKWVPKGGRKQEADPGKSVEDLELIKLS